MTDHRDQQPVVDPVIERRLQHLGGIAGLAAIGVGLIAILGWKLQAFALTQLFTGRSAMQPVTALCAILAGGCVLVASRRRLGNAVCVLAALVVVVALQTLAEHLFGLDFGTDRLLFPQAITAQPGSYTFPGRMAAPTATAFLLLATAVAALQISGRIALRVAGLLATAVLFLATIAFLQHLYSVEPFTGVLSFTQVALPTAAALASLSIGILALRPDSGWIALLVGKSVGATAARWLVPLLAVIPVAVAWFALRGSQLGYYPADFRLALTTGVTIILLCGLTLWGSCQLDNLFAARRDADALRAEQTTLKAFFETDGLFASILELRGNEVVYLAANHALSKLFGRNDITGLSQRDLVSAEESETLAQRLREIARTGIPSISEELHRASGEQRWFIVTTAPISGPNKHPRFTTASFEITARKQAEAHQQLLLQELNHRVKNTLAVVHSLAQQTFRGDQATQDAKQAFEARLMAVASANDLLIRQDWETVSLLNLARGTVGPGCGADAARVEIGGPEIALPPKMAVSVTLALHELCTNAVKYGALSNDVGRVSLTWNIAEEDEGPRLQMQWVESGGPPVAVPQDRGFGSRLIERALSIELRGPVRIDFRPQGVICEIDAPLPTA